jgi:hypothetical protein
MLGRDPRAAVWDSTAAVKAYPLLEKVAETRLVFGTGDECLAYGTAT